ncbi:MAG: pyridoxal 5'-phosphate synthase glutaminase subunit PdxT [Actinobacteria bacterium]|nr:pyridoxal 5'-phosphate synthase glutaminase subunit PdxT [Actinomycetota bacterium]
MTTGILSLQGNFLDHARSLELINKEYTLVKQLSDIKHIDSLILPGGESTSMIKIQSNNELFNKLKILIQDGIPTIGTCAGLILLAKDVIDGEVALGVLDCVVERNAYGRQNESFEGLVNFIDNTQMYCFIRAPKILKTGNKVKNIAFIDDEVVGVQHNNIAGFTFHPELTNDKNYLSWLKFFIEEGKNVRSF